MINEKDIYILRHGESLANVNGLRNGPNTPLTKEGKKQAKKAAKNILRFNVEIAISSPLVRTRETAEIVTEKTRTGLEFDPLLQERRTPSEIFGMRKDDPTVVQIQQQIYKNYHTPKWRYSNEENFEDLKKRAKRTLKMIQERPESRILLISHAFYMRFLHSYILHDQDLTSHDFERILYSHEIGNTGITHYKIKESAEEENGAGPRFILKGWGDTSHLN